MLTNPGADRVRAVRALATRSGRRRTGRFVAEGPQAVRELVACAPHLVVDVYLTEAAAGRYPEIWDSAAGLHRHLGDEAVLTAMSGDAQGVLAVATVPVGGAALAQGAAAQDAGPVGPLPAAALDAVLAARPRLVAVLAQVRDPGNLGTVVRVADAAGAQAVVVAGAAVEPTNPKVVRSTAGSLFHLPVVSGVDVPAAVAAVRGAGLAVLAADGVGKLDLDDLQDAAARGEDVRGEDVHGADLRRPTAWLFGNEAWGLPAADRGLADAVVRVPLRGRAESLNLAAAAAVCLYASSRALRRPSS